MARQTAFARFGQDCAFERDEDKLEIGEGFEKMSIYQGIKTSDYPELKADIADSSLCFMEMFFMWIKYDLETVRQIAGSSEPSDILKLCKWAEKNGQTEFYIGLHFCLG